MAPATIAKTATKSTPQEPERVVIVVRYGDAEGKILSETESEPRVLDEPGRKWLSEQKRTVATGPGNGTGP
jgi:hypothetical protein